jgi:hypothetical protein
MKRFITLLTVAVVICEASFSANGANQDQKKAISAAKQDLINRGFANSSLMTNLDDMERMQKLADRERTNAIITASAARQNNQEVQTQGYNTAGMGRRTGSFNHDQNQALAQAAKREKTQALQKAEKQEARIQALEGYVKNASKATSEKRDQATALAAQREKTQTLQKTERQKTERQEKERQEAGKQAVERQAAERYSENASKAAASAKRDLTTAAEDRLAGGPGVVIDAIGSCGKNSFDCIIGGHIYRQGDTLNGFKVRTISASEVIFEKDGKTFSRGL